MTAYSPYQQLRQIGIMVNRLSAQSGIDEYDISVLKALDTLKRAIDAAQDTLKDYEMYGIEENTRMQAGILPHTLKSLEKVRESLLKVSEYNLIGAADVAQISAELDEIIVRLR